MMPYLPHTGKEKQEMLKAVGSSSIQELFRDIPEDIFLKRPLNLAEGLSEYEVFRKLSALAAENDAASVSFLGFGSYDHIIPSTVGHLASRSEFYTSYTPYQAEMSQGILQAIFEFQSMVAELTGLDVANASLYDGHTAAVEGASMALQAAKKADTVLYAESLHPFTKEVLKTAFSDTWVKLEEVSAEDGVTSLDALKARLRPGVAGVVVQSPNAWGWLEDYSGFAEAVHANGSLFVVSANPMALGAVKSPAEWGADIAVGDVQPFGLRSFFGGPSAGYIAAREGLLRRMPGRIVGKTFDRDGKRAFVLTLQAREQHIRRERATSNICSNQALAALSATIYLSTLGKAGLREAAEQNIRKAHYLFRRLCTDSAVKPLHQRPFFNEFTLRIPGGRERLDVLLRRMKEAGILAGIRTGQFIPAHDDALTVAVTEKRSRQELDRYAELFREVLA